MTLTHACRVRKPQEEIPYGKEWAIGFTNPIKEHTFKVEGLSISPKVSKFTAKACRQGLRLYASCKAGTSYTITLPKDLQGLWPLNLTI